MSSIAYVCPVTRSALTEVEKGLMGQDGIIFPYLSSLKREDPVPNFLEGKKIGDLAEFSLTMYKSKESLDVYQHFLTWLFKTFEEDENTVRQSMVSKLNLKKGAQVLITGCGLGDDLQYILKEIGVTGKLYAQDISAEMVLHAQKSISTHKDAKYFGKTFFSIGDALELPFRDNYFDAAFHFGGINLFDDVKAAIKEMDRVVASGGRVVFGDEGIAPWLKNTEYGKIAICNNKLWAVDAPISLLPEKCLNVNISWILGNCFYLIDFDVSDEGPYMNIDLPHKGKRGGNMRSRYYGQLEGVTPEIKDKVIKASAAEGISIHEWLEQVILKELSYSGRSL